MTWMPRPGSPSIATLAYGAIAAVMTWPLATVMHREIASDMGDPLLNCWVLLWTAGQTLRFLSGDLHALSQYWHGNIFHPEPLTLAYSEHLTGQMLQILPVFAATGNVVFSYNLLFLSTYVLSGLGMFLLVRELTNRPLAAFVAGLAFAFAPYRLSQFSHLQVLSSQWMPFALYAFRRYFVTGRTRPLVGAAAALVAQNLSNGYYLLFFSPFAAAYCLYEMVSRKRLGDGRTWRALGRAALVVVLITGPFVVPYVNVRKSAGIGVRSPGEIAMFSADTQAFATASTASWFWARRMPGFKKDEGDGFPGATILVLSAIAVAWGTRRSWSAARRSNHAEVAPWRGAVGGALGVALLASLYAVLSFLIRGQFEVPSPGGLVRYRNAGPFFLQALVLAGLLVAFVPAVRRFLSGTRGSVFGFFVVGALATAALSLGPVIKVADHAIATGPYAWLLAVVPGFDGLRVPARFLMLMAMCLAVLAGFGAAAVMARWRRPGTVALVGACAAILLESWASGFNTNVRMAAEGLDLTPREVRMGQHIDPLYKFLRDVSEPVVLIEFPFASHAWDIHAMFYAGYHRRKLVNGYSGFFSDRHARLEASLSRIPADLERAWEALVSTGATHALVHEAAFPEGRQQEISQWIRRQGGREMMKNGTNVLFRLH